MQFKLRTMFTLGEILPATHPNGKQNTQFQIKLISSKAEVTRVNRSIFWCFTFPRYELLLG